MAAIQKGWGPKLSGRLAEYVNATNDTILVGSIQAHMMKEHSKPSDRRQDIIHPSEMAHGSWCPRATYYRIKACREAQNPFLKPPENVGVQLLNIFDEGHMIHAKWQKRLTDMGKLWGNWKCGECSKIFKDTYSPEQCAFCNSMNLIYTEVPLQADQYLIYGHADGAVPHLNALIEIKSVGPGTVRVSAPEVYAAHSEGSMIDLQGLWKGIKEPFPDHVRQGQLYLTLCSLMGLSFDKIIFIYESKFNQGVKEFVVKYDPEYCDDMLKQASIIVNTLKGYQPNGEDCPVCCHKNLDYPFLCECADPVKCPTGTCKDCEIYSGNEKSDSTRVGKSTTEVNGSGIKSTGSTIRRASGTSSRIVRST